METNIPSTSTVFKTLLRADLATLFSNRRSVVISILVPLIILVSWKSLIPHFGGPFALSGAITVGLMAIGLMGYTISVAKDRDKGIFQRLRVAPVPAWCIMASRILIQWVMIMILTLLVFIVGYQYDGVKLSAEGYLLTFGVAILGGGVYLSLGQLIVGLIKNFETINATTRLVYFVFIMVGMFGDFGMLGEYVKKGSHWSPYGAVKTMLAASMDPAQWTNDTTIIALVCVGYIIVFAGVGISKFKWSTK
jgi:ABC-2 type transport system permease protein